MPCFYMSDLSNFIFEFSSKEKIILRPKIFNKLKGNPCTNTDKYTLNRKFDYLGFDKYINIENTEHIHQTNLCFLLLLNNYYAIYVYWT